MKEVITTLPISPQENPSLGLLIPALIADIFAKRYGFDLLLSLNTTGLRYQNTNSSAAIEGYIGTLEKANITISDIWIDDNRNNDNDFRQILVDLKNKDILIGENIDVSGCPCGINEYPTISENWSTKRKLSLENKICKICEGSIISRNRQTTLMQFKDYPIANVYPEFIQKDLTSQLTRIFNRKSLVSKDRPTAIQVDGFDRRFDVDVLWQNYLNILNRQSVSVDYIIGSNHSLREIAMVMAYTASWSHRLPTLIIPPYFRVAHSGIMPKANQLLETYGAPSVRLLVAANLNWNSKETFLDLSQMELFNALAIGLLEQEIPATMVVDRQQWFKEVNHIAVRDQLGKFRRFSSRPETNLGLFTGII